MNMRAARKKLGLTLSQFAELHRMTSHGARRWELDPSHSGYRQPSGSAMAFTDALLAGYRPGMICDEPGDIVE